MTGTDWLGALSLLGPVATGAAAVVALVVGIATVRQRDRADRREQWWRRAEWALGLTLSDDWEAVRRGYAVLDHLVGSDLATADERGLLRAASELGLNAAHPPPQDGRGVPGAADEGGVSGGPVRPGDRGAGASP
ncbi:hypothetical protein [Cellulomonas pakistanensis]|uniref:Uncharacterized protein n=1 Tax=Cellulomonas pakistanensis TaxID=992287 RepID=A0A919PBF4_9CELL|nr:hypothetical protein [Cellulomonas pakistanensis]GIG36571.1 hypothetical protein Cpa01nite_19520 [Cellulomonas pakistanensis]